MKHKMFVIFDSKAHAYMTPFFMHHEDMAIREFSNAVNDQEHAFGKHPADYTLFEIGSYADNTAQIEINKASINLGVGIQFKTQEKQRDLFNDTRTFEDLNPEEQTAELQAFARDHGEDPVKFKSIKGNKK